jgi:hypothetical protein
MIRLLGDEIELNGTVVARLVPGSRLSLRDELAWALDAIDEDRAYIAELEARIGQLEARLKQNPSESSPHALTVR